MNMERVRVDGYDLYVFGGISVGRWVHVKRGTGIVAALHRGDERPIWWESGVSGLPAHVVAVAEEMAADAFGPCRHAV